MTRGGREVRVYCFGLEPGPECLVELEDLLSEAERERAAGFHFPRDRDRYVAAHGTLRRILAQVAHRAPAELAFARGPHAKPALVVGRGEEPIHFNLSGAGSLAVVAVASAGEVGVDVEQVRPLDALGIARRMFAPAEHAALLALPEAGRLAAFLRYWTCKEAVVKAIGEGLFLPLQSFVLPADAGESPHAIWLEGEMPVWVGVLPAPEPGYAAAVASTFAPSAVRFGWWEEAGPASPAAAASDRTAPAARTPPPSPAPG